MVSMKDIARRCGVSVATVSKALNGHKDIGEETRRRIHDTAREMGYMTNSAARALKTNRTYNLGILFVDEQRNGLAHEYFGAMLESFRQAAERHGYDITFINQKIGGKTTSYLQHCRYRRVDGVVIACVSFEDPMVQELVESDIPLVTIDRIFDERISVLSDNVEGVSSLVRYAYGKGHRKIAFIHGEPSAVTECRLQGFRQTCEELGLDIPPGYIVPSIYHNPDLCEEGTRKLLALPDRPTCILFSDDFSYIGGVNVLREAKLRIPEDISVVGYDGIHLARMMRLTTYSQNAAALGETAAEKLISLIEHPESTPIECIKVQGKFLEGNTVKQI